MVDMEGISGVFNTAQVGSKGEVADYFQSRKYYTWDANACIEGCFSGGAEEVIVMDAHGGGNHFVWEELDARARYVRGRSPLERMPEIDSCDGLVLLGYHAMAGTRHAVLEHTMNSKVWQNLWINGKKAGEVAIDAGIAGDYGVPTIMVSGDDKVCNEAKSIIPGIIAAEVKKGLDLEGAILLSKEKAHELIRSSAATAVKKCGKMKPYKLGKPVTMRLELVSRNPLPVSNPKAKIIDGRTYEVTCPTVQEALFSL